MYNFLHIENSIDNLIWYPQFYLVVLNYKIQNFP